MSPIDAEAPTDLGAIAGSSRRSGDGRVVAFMMVLIYAGVIWFGVSGAKPDRAWALFGVPVIGTHFGDLYVFPAAQQAIRAGEDPYARNPRDPWGRSFNYPLAWLLFARFSTAAVPTVGVTLGFVWVSCVFLWWGKFPRRWGWVMGLALCSPSIVLALERGNSDLFIWLVLSAGLLCLKRSWLLGAWAVFFLATALKLYPVVAFIAFLRVGGRRGAAWVASGITAAGLWFVVHVVEIVRVTANTPADHFSSYGSSNWVLALNALYRGRTEIVDGFSHLLWPSHACAAALILAAVLAGARSAMQDRPGENGASLDAFRIGAAIYIFTFVLGSHYVYRHMFLLFVVPWLLGNIRGCCSRLRPWCWAALVLVMGCMWINPAWYWPLLFARDWCGWGLAFVLAWLLGATARHTAVSSAHRVHVTARVAGAPALR